MKALATFLPKLWPVSMEQSAVKLSRPEHVIFTNPQRVRHDKADRAVCVANPARSTTGSSVTVTRSSPPTPAPATVPIASTATSLLPALKDKCCDKCDGKHDTDQCPYYKKQREAHPDAQKSKHIGGAASLLPGAYLTTARVARQPGDGSCLFHSISYGANRLGVPSGTGGTSHSAASLRQLVCQFVRNNPSTLICDTPLQDWVRWDSGSSVADYASRMRGGAWGGGIEMACLSALLLVNIHVYERHGVGYRRISAFDCATSAASKPTVRVLYGGGVHYGEPTPVLYVY